MRPYGVEAFVIEAVKDERLPCEIPGFKPGSDFMFNVLSNCPGLIVAPSSAAIFQETLPFCIEDPYAPSSLDQIELSQVSYHHVRSFEVKHPDLDTPWQDEFGHQYASLNLKGNNFSHPEIISFGNAPGEFAAFGLQESSVMRRALRSSRLLRENGITTEYFVGLAEPKTLPWTLNGDLAGIVEPVSIAEYKRRIVEARWLGLPDDKRTVESLIELSTKLNQVTFYVSARAMDTSIRFWDMQNSTRLRSEAFDIYNKHYLSPDQTPYESGKDEKQRFMNEVFIPNISRNLAKLHKLGLAHRFPVELNMTAFGSIVDLDSVHGEALELGDEPVTNQDIARDLLIIACNVYDSANEVYPILDKPTNDLLEQFITSYFDELTADLDTDEQKLAVTSNVIFGLQALVADMDDNSGHLYGNHAKGLSNRIRKIFSAKFKPQENWQSAKLLDDWIDKLPEDTHERAKQYVKDNLDLFVFELNQTYINELADNPAYLEDKPLANIPLLNDWLRATVVEVAEEYFDEYLEGIVANASEEERQRLTWLRDSCRALTSQGELWEKLEGWSAEVASKILDELRDDLSSAIKLDTSKYFFEDHISYPLLFVTPNKYMLQTDEVPIGELDKLFAEDIDFQVELLQKADDRINRERIMMTADGSRPTQLITDDVVDGIVSEFKSPLTEITFDLGRDASYALLIEEKPDKSLRARLLLQDEDQVEVLNLSLDMPLTFRQLFMSQLTLFS